MIILKATPQNNDLDLLYKIFPGLGRILFKKLRLCLQLTKQSKSGANAKSAPKNIGVVFSLLRYTKNKNKNIPKIISKPHGSTFFTHFFETKQFLYYRGPLGEK